MSYIGGDKGVGLVLGGDSAEMPPPSGRLSESAPQTSSGLEIMSSGQIFGPGGESGGESDEPVSPRTLNERVEELREAMEVGKAYFTDRASNLPSQYALQGFDDRVIYTRCFYCSHYKVRVPELNERLWMTPNFGEHGVPTLYLELGLHFPMHPFHAEVLFAIGCGLFQLAPNGFAQVSGVIARCYELGRPPTLQLLCSIYEIRRTPKGVYLYARKGRAALVQCPKSHSAWSEKYVFVKGFDMEFLPYCQEVPQARLDFLNKMERVGEPVLWEVCGSESRYKLEQFADPKFLSAHQLGGDSLREALKRGVAMPSEEMIARMLRDEMSVPTAKSGERTVGSSRSVKIVQTEEKRITPGAQFSEPLSVRNASRPSKVPPAKLGGESSAGKASQTSSRKRVREEMVSKELPKKMRPEVSGEEGDLTLVIKAFERWGIAERAPLRALSIFTLPEDKQAHEVLSMEDKVERLKRRSGLMMSDVMLMVDEFEEFGKEVGRLRIKRKNADVKLKDAKSKLDDATATINQLKQERGSFVLRAETAEKAHLTATTEVNQLKAEVDRLKADLAEALETKDAVKKELKEQAESFEDEIGGLEEKLEKAYNEGLVSWKEGYETCLGKFVAADCDPTGKTYNDYKAELRAQREGLNTAALADPAGAERAVGGTGIFAAGQESEAFNEMRGAAALAQVGEAVSKSAGEPSSLDSVPIPGPVLDVVPLAREDPPANEEEASVSPGQV